MRLVLILLVLAIVGWLTVSNMKSQSNAVGDAARKAGVEVPKDAPPREQVEAVGKAVEKMQAEEAERMKQQLEQAEGASK